MSGEAATELRVEPKFNTLGLLPRPAFGLGRSMLARGSILVRGSMLVRGSGNGGAGCDMLDAADLQPFNIDFRTLGFFSGGGGTFAGG